MTARTWVCALSVASILGTSLTLAGGSITATAAPQTFPQALTGPQTALPKTNPNRDRGNKQGEVARLEAQIAANQAAADEANLSLQQSAEAYGRAADVLTQAQQAASEAQNKAEQARDQAAAARKKLGQLAATLYRQNALGMTSLEAVTDPQGFRRAALKQEVSTVIGAKVDAQVQQLTALQDVAEVMQNKAQQAVQAQRQASTKLKQTKNSAQEKAKKAQVNLQQVTQRREQIISQLARARGVSAEDETARQEQIENERRARQEAQAAQALAQRAQQEAARRASEAQKAAQAQTARVQREAQAAQRAQQESARKAQAAQEAAQKAERARAKAAQEAARQVQEQAAKQAAQAQAARQAEAEKAAARQREAQQAAREQAQREAAARQAQARAAQAAAREAAARAAQGRAAQNATEMATGPVEPSKYGPALLSWARTKIGIPYVWGATGPDGYDCSGLVFDGMRQIGGGAFARSAAAQYQNSHLVPFNQAQPGDLVFWSNNGDASGIYHVAIYSGPGTIVMAPKPGQNILELGLYNQNKIMPFVGRI